MVVDDDGARAAVLDSCHVAIKYYVVISSPALPQAPLKNLRMGALFLEDGLSRETTTVSYRS